MCRDRRALAAALDDAGDAVTELRPQAVKGTGPSEPPSTASCRSAVIVASLSASVTPSSARAATQGGAIRGECSSPCVVASHGPPPAPSLARAAP